MSSSKSHVERLRCRELQIPFKVAFRHASAERAETSSVWVNAIASDGATGCGESCPRPYVTGETPETVRAFVLGHEPALCNAVTDVGTLQQWLDSHHDEIDANPAAWCAVELALLDLFGKQQRTSVEGLLSQPPLRGRFQYTAVVGDASETAFRTMTEQYWQRGFRDYKVKLSGNGERDRNKMAVFRQWPLQSIRVRVDANNLWPTADAAIAAVRELEYPLFAVEEPITSHRHSELSLIARALDCPIVLDESFVRREQLGLLDEPMSQWIINVRVSKMGGLIRSLRIVDEVQARGIKIIVGAQVGETSLLTRAGLTVAQAAGKQLVAQEGAFGTLLLERDVCDPPLMFGAGGVLDVADHPMLELPGLGSFSITDRAGLQTDP
jgi:L-alanine-DL-glutamate epimerase-like enolase superfamily enzyme